MRFYMWQQHVTYIQRMIVHTITPRNTVQEFEKPAQRSAERRWPLKIVWTIGKSARLLSATKHTKRHISFQKAFSVQFISARLLPACENAMIMYIHRPIHVLFTIARNRAQMTHRWHKDDTQMTHKQQQGGKEYVRWGPSIPCSQHHYCGMSMNTCISHIAIAATRTNTSNNRHLPHPRPCTMIYKAHDVQMPLKPERRVGIAIVVVKEERLNGGMWHAWASHDTYTCVTIHTHECVTYIHMCHDTYTRTWMSHLTHIHTSPHWYECLGSRVWVRLALPQE